MNAPEPLPVAALSLSKLNPRAKRPLAEATLRRIARGVMRYVVENPRPFIVPAGGAMVAPVVSYAQQGGGNRPADAPMHTICASAKDQNTLLAACLVPRYGERPGQAPRCAPVDGPAPVIVPTGNGAGLVAAFLAQHNGGPRNDRMAGRAADAPLSTLACAGAQQQIVAAKIVRDFGESGKAGLVAAFLTKYYGTGDGAGIDAPLHTDTTKDRFGLVTVEIDGASYVIVDIGMRMLTPRERFRAQGFPEAYRIEEGLDEAGRAVRLSLDAQGRMCGNSVCPPIAAALVSANAPELAAERSAA